MHMISVYSPRRRARVLLSERHVQHLHNVDGAVVAEVLTEDDETVFVVTGRGAPRDPRRARQLVMSLVANRCAASNPKIAA